MVKLIDIPEMNYFAKDGKGEVQILQLNNNKWKILRKLFVHTV